VIKVRKTLLTLVLLAAAGMAGLALPFNENFDRAEPGKFPAGWEDGGDYKATCTVVDQTVLAPHSPPYCLRMADDSPGAAAQIGRIIIDQAKGKIIFAFHVPAATPGDFYCTFTKSGETVLDFQASGGGNLKYRNAEKVLQETGKKFALDAWHLAEIAWNLESGAFSLAVDGVKIGDYPFITKVAPDRVVFKLGSSNKVGQAAFLDSIALTE